jgi:hypothetical protein
LGRLEIDGCFANHSMLSLVLGPSAASAAPDASAMQELKHEPIRIIGR